MVGNQSKAQRKLILPAANLICWELWKERNRRIFDKKRDACACVYVTNQR
jgi:hypothetical protein